MYSLFYICLCIVHFTHTNRDWLIFIVQYHPPSGDTFSHFSCTTISMENISLNSKAYFCHSCNDMENLNTIFWNITGVEPVTNIKTQREKKYIKITYNTITHHYYTVKERELKSILYPCFVHLLSFTLI